MRKVLKIFAILGLIMFFLISLFSCKTAEKIVTKTEYVKIHDTISIEKKITDTIEIKTEVEKIREVKSNVFLPCPPEGEKGGSGRNQSGDNYTDWKYDEEKGGYNVELFCAAQINKKDSIIQKLTKEIETYKSNSSEIKNESDTKIVTEKPHWWQSFFKNIWKVLFFTVAILWVLGFTPKFIFKKILTSVF